MLEFKPLSLYVHIPFCKKKCLYCDFLSFSGCEGEFDDYTKFLLNEIASCAQEFKNSRIKTLFIGGGTPTFLPVKNMGQIIDALYSKLSFEDDAEITIEANPGTVDKSSLNEYYYMGINRLSFGLQAWQNKHLRTLGRIHDRESFVKNYLDARDIGFNNINIDLMFSYYGQTLSDWEETLANVLSLKPEHISAYSLIIEEGTPYKKLFDEKKIFETDEETDRKMYYMTKEMLESENIFQYEISNYSKPGFESRHNTVYWETKEYLGLGLGAHSFIGNARFANTRDMKAYYENKGMKDKIVDFKEILSKDDLMAEFMFMGLRMNRGISFSEFKQRFGTDIYEVYKNELMMLSDEKLIDIGNNRAYLTDRGRDIANFVFEKFIK